MRESWECKECGTRTHPSAWPHRLCPRCLMAGGLDPDEPPPPEYPKLETDAEDLEANAQRIGPYRILRRMGSGSQGVVYEAEQREPRRTVALKVVRGGRDVDDDLVKLFRREVRTLARLQHPAIAAIYDSGTTSEGEHYFAMEWVSGRTLSEFFTERVGQVGLPEETRVRLELFRRICEAVNYAHQRGVIHRDLKPSNILVLNESDAPSGAAPRIKILDFGLARIFDPEIAASTMTELGKIKGTLPYMSPEQMRGDSTLLDVRTDVYSLGVILFEMLTGRLPHSYGTPVEFIRGVSSDSPTPLAQVWPGSRGPDRDLETIVYKALEKEPDRRYQSPLALSEDIERFLTNQPILARPPSTSYQLGKLLMRHKLPVALGALSVLLLVAFAVGMTLQAGRIANERDRANREAVTARRVSDFLVELFDVRDPSKLPASITVGELMERGVENIKQELANEPEIRARMLNTLGLAHRELSMFEVSAELIEEGLQIRREHLGPEHPDVAESLHTLGALRLEEREREEAARLLEEALRIRKAKLGPAHLDTARTLGNLGTTYLGLRRYGEAEAMLERSVAIKEGRADVDLVDLSRTLNNLAILYKNTDRIGDAERMYKRVIEMRTAALGPQNAMVAGAQNNLAVLLHEQGRLTEAKPLYREALPITERAYGPDHPRVINFRGNVATLHNGLGEYADAEALWRACLESQERHSGVNSPETAGWLVNLVSVLKAQGRLDDAATTQRRLLAVREAELGASSLSFAEVLEHSAGIMRELGRDDEALGLQNRALAVRQAQQ